MSADFHMVQYEDIEARLLMDRNRRGTVMPRFTPAQWWECDVCEVSESGYFREYEIKMSRADFRVDAGKAREIFDGAFHGIGAPPRPVEKKHDLLAAGSTRGPANFYFVTPAGLLSESELPLWAGLIEISVDRPGAYAVERIIRKAPRLHRQKADAQLALQMHRTAYGRLHYAWSQSYQRKLCDRSEKAAPAA